MTEELQTVIAPQILSVHEEFWIYFEDQPFVDGIQKYKIPTRAIGNKLKDIVAIDGGGNIQNLPRLTYTDISQSGFNDFHRLYGFYLEGSDVHLYPDDNYIGSDIRMYYYRRPSDLVVESAAGEITLINTVSKEVTVGAAPTSWTTSNIFDFVKGIPPFYSLGDDQPITMIGANTLTFTNDLPAGLEVGDWVALNSESPIPQLQYEGHPLLAQRGAIKVLEALGDAAGLQAAKQEYAQLHKDFFILINPRVDEEPKKLVSRKGLWRTKGRNSWLR